MYHFFFVPLQSNSKYTDMKKLFLPSAILLLTICLASCGGTKNEPEQPQQDTTAVDPDSDATAIDRVQVQKIGANCIAYMLYHDDSGKAFVYPIYIAEGAEDVEEGKTYTIDEMNKVYTYWMLSDYTTHSLFTEATFKKTMPDGKLRIDATAKDQNGDQWKLLYKE